MVTVDDFFSENSDWEEKSSAFAKALATVWVAKLKKDFPNLNFKVEYFHNEDYGDYGITFYQVNNTHQMYDASKEISAPSIKESKIEQSLNGPRPGIPKIRKARITEIPYKSLK